VAVISWIRATLALAAKMEMAEEDKVVSAGWCSHSAGLFSHVQGLTVKVQGYAVIVWEVQPYQYQVHLST
jgi:hypothetical protein